MKRSMWATALVLLAFSTAFGSPVLDAPPVSYSSKIHGQSNPNSVETSGPGGDNTLDPTICFDATSTTMFFQYELNEQGNDSQISLALDLWHDPNLNFMNDGGTEDDGFTGDLEPAIFLGAATGGPTAFEYTMSGLTVNERYCIGLDVEESSNGRDYAGVSSSAAAVPEPSSFLFLGMLSTLLTGRGWWRNRRS